MSQKDWPILSSTSSDVHASSHVIQCCSPTAWSVQAEFFVPRFGRLLCRCWLDPGLMQRKEQVVTTPNVCTRDQQSLYAVTDLTSSAFKHAAVPIHL